jgi:hypothetical protein
MKSKGMAMKAGAFVQLVTNADKRVVEVQKSRGWDSLGGCESHTKTVVEGKCYGL